MNAFYKQPVYKRAFLILMMVWIGFMAFRYFDVFATANVMDHYSFRQAQVATVARELADGGPWFPYLMPVLGPPWAVPLEFPVYQILVGWMSNSTGLSIEQAARILSMLSAFVSLVLIARISSLLEFDDRTGFLITFLTGFSPLFMYWSSAVMIESFTVALCLGFVWCAFEYLKRDNLKLLALGTLLAILAALAKATTFLVFAIAVFLVFAALYIDWVRQQWSEMTWSKMFQKAIPWFIYGCALILPAVIIAQVWINFSDQVKMQSPLTEFTSSASLHKWNYGTYGDFKDAMGYWFLPFRGGFISLSEQMLGAFWLLLTGLALVGTHLDRRHRISVLILILVTTSGPLIFSNLYEVHYYYWVANFAFYTAAIAIGLSGFTRAVANGLIKFLPSQSRMIEGLAIAPVLGLCLVGTQLSLDSAFLDRTKNASKTIPTIGAEIEAATTPDDIIFTFGYDWDPSLQYYSNRKMLMARSPKAALDHASAIEIDPALLVFCGRAKTDETRISILSHEHLSDTEWQAQGEERHCNVYAPVL